MRSIPAAAAAQAVPARLFYFINKHLFQIIAIYNLFKQVAHGIKIVVDDS